MVMTWASDNARLHSDADAFCIEAQLNHAERDCESDLLICVYVCAGSVACVLSRSVCVCVCQGAPSRPGGSGLSFAHALSSFPLLLLILLDGPHSATSRLLSFLREIAISSSTSSFATATPRYHQFDFLRPDHYSILAHFTRQKTSLVPR
ncbi:hypothetical protein BCV70DRAFT_46507 [Testicularia cyperi]|uniref:Uncharacterized protein n=1 Tax=Testicularia cyperi TaxID=1882483 RepID=A0A317XID8_9BASI|nr:hypothetical protein BCV70DRAFT_46507 [Testicularia cyperi]